MKRLPLQYICVSAITGFALTCRPNTTTEPVANACQPPQSMVVQAPCESGYPGALLIASDFSTGASGSLLFEIFPQKDTLSNDLSVRGYKNGATTRERLLVGTDVLNDAPKFVAQVSLTCDGKERKSPYFSFVKRNTGNPDCYVWALQKQ